VEKAKVLLAFVQILGSFEMVYPKIPWPEDMKSLFRTLSIFDLDLSTLFSYASMCSLRLVGFIPIFRFRMCLFPLLILMVVMAHFVAKLAGWRPSLKLLVQNSIITILFLYPSICTAIFQIFSCDPVTHIKSFLVEDLSLECWGNTHRAIVSEGIAGIIVYVIGIPISIFIVLHQFRNRTQLIKILCSAYKEEWHYLECLQLLRKATLTGFLILVPDDSSARILLGSMVSLLYFLFIALSNPYKDSEVYCLDLVASFTLILSAQGALALKYTQQMIGYSDETNRPLSPSAAAEVNVVGAALMALNVIVVIFGVIVTLKDELRYALKRICGAAAPTQASDPHSTKNSTVLQAVPVNAAAASGAAASLKKVEKKLII